MAHVGVAGKIGGFGPSVPVEVVDHHRPRRNPAVGPPDHVHQVARPAAPETGASPRHRGCHDEAVRVREKHLYGVERALGLVVPAEHEQLAPVGDRPVVAPRLDQLHVRGVLRVGDGVVHFDPIGRPQTVTFQAPDHPYLVQVLDGERVFWMPRFYTRISPNSFFHVVESALGLVAVTEEQYLVFELAGDVECQIRRKNKEHPFV